MAVVLKKSDKIIYMILNVIDVEYLGDYKLLCKFNNGAVKQVDMAPLLQYEAFKDLTDKTKFEQFGLHQTIFWANGADIAPEWLLEHGTDIPA